MMDTMDETRARPLNEGTPQSGPVLYWMSRDQRAADNWALHFAQEYALRQRVPLAVVFCLLPVFGEATIRQYSFMLRGLAQTATRLLEVGIPFFLLEGCPTKTLPEFIAQQGIGMLITDFSPLRFRKEWVGILRSRISLPFWEVDAHNVVPVWQASDKQEWSARTFRPKIGHLLSHYLVPFPPLRKHPYPWTRAVSIPDFDAIGKRLSCDRSVLETGHLAPGITAARETLNRFLTKGLERYAQQRNDPNAEAQSGLSPYLHFGQISAARVALEVLKQPESKGRDDFMDQLIVRRELAENFCEWNPHYDAWVGFPAWGGENWISTGQTSNPISAAKMSWSLASPAIPCGMRLKRKWFAGEQCRAICVCIGQKSCWNGRWNRRKLTALPSASMIATCWMAAIPMDTRVLLGVLVACTIARGTKDPYSATSGG